MKVFILLLGLIACAISAVPPPPLLLFSEQELDIHFEQFKKNYGRSYPSAQVELERRQIFAANLEFIFEHNLEANQGKRRFTVSVNNFTDLTGEEFRSLYNNNNGNFQEKPEGSQMHIPKSKDLPPEVDWVAAGAVTPIKDQGPNCGGGDWAFAAVATIESLTLLLLKEPLPNLSEQQLIDCSAAQGNSGCDAGGVDNAFSYGILNHGIDTTASYPYHGRTQSNCAFNPATAAVKLGCYIDIGYAGSEYNLQDAIANVGPVAVSVDASHPSFQFYKSGVYDEPQCSNSIPNLNRAMTVVGYGSTTQDSEPKDYYRVKNSWGTAWGESGYIRMSRNKRNQCGIATQASYPCVMPPSI